jgi:hypothetical protein
LLKVIIDIKYLISPARLSLSHSTKTVTSNNSL